MSTTIYVLSSGFETPQTTIDNCRETLQSHTRCLQFLSVEVLYQRDANAVRCLWFTLLLWIVIWRQQRETLPSN